MTKIGTLLQTEKIIRQENVSLIDVCYNIPMVKSHKSDEKAATPKVKTWVRGQHPMPAFLRITCAFLFIFVMAIFFTWFILWRTNMCDGDAAWNFTQEKPVLTTYSFLIVLGILAVITSLTWRPFLSCGLFFCIISVISFIHMQKFQLRAEPLLPEEFQMADQAGNIMQFVDTDAVTRLVFGVIFVMIGSILAEYMIDKLVGRNLKPLAWWNRLALVPRVTFLMMSLAFLASMSAPIIHHRQPEWLEGVKLVAWNQTENYENNGFIIGFVYNLGRTEVKRPEDYSEKTMLAMADKYRKVKAEDKERKSWDEEIDNLVIVLAETFYDPALLTKYYPHRGGDVTPVVHEVFENYPSGYMYSPEYGGGTANIEFEVQTGLSNYWAMTIPYTDIVTKLNSIMSPADFGWNYDFRSIGVHSYAGSMYKRNLVYPVMGYEEFRDYEDMTYQERDGNSSVYNDRAIYQEVLDIIKNDDAQKVISVVTMQNHAPYGQAQYPEHDFPLLDQNTENGWVIESSFQSLHNSDQYLGEFLEALDEIDERTVVLWFGDHAMGNLSEYALSEDKTDRTIAHLTPYFIYANFDFEKPYTSTETAKLNAKQELEFTNKDIDLPTTTPNCLLNTVYNTFNLEKPAMFYLVDKVCKSVPILARPYTNGEPLPNTTTIHEYELLNYDILYGHQYWDGE